MYLNICNKISQRKSCRGEMIIGIKDTRHGTREMMNEFYLEAKRKFYNVENSFRGK
jgi:hypothetical protein